MNTQLAGRQNSHLRVDGEEFRLAEVICAVDGEEVMNKQGAVMFMFQWTGDVELLIDYLRT